MSIRVRKHCNPLNVKKRVSFDGFENDNPIFVDVGAFKGEFVFKLAKLFPNYNYILFEMRPRFAEFLTEMFKDYRNVKVFDGDAGSNFSNILLPSLRKGIFLHTVFVNFPDPWPKLRHKKRRFINVKFLREIEKWFPKEGRFCFQTDQEELFADTKMYIKETNFRVSREFAGSPFGIRSHWEIRKIKEKKKIYRVCFTLE